MSTSFWDEKTEVAIHYSSFPWIQGQVLRAAVDYVAALDGNPALDEQALRDAGVPLPDPSVAVAEFRAAISEALVLLRSWVREPVERENVWGKMFGAKGFVETTPMLESQYPMTEMLNLPFIACMVLEHPVCPPCLARLGLDGVYIILEVSEDLSLSHEGAKVMVDMLDRLEPYADWSGWEHEDSDNEGEDEDEEDGGASEVKEKKPEGTAGEQMRAVFAACAADPESSIVS
ncbi:hypothetical protein DFH09DRAFT_1307172 [Mycena vulgaris]|nr:hypothetical protein DFH09DRAFT_1307172 [Mycena vulgaris]